MKSSQTIFIDAEGNAIPDGGAGRDPKSLLVREGREISDAKLDQYPGARALAEGKGKKAPKEAPEEKVIETRPPAVQHRDPRQAETKKKK